jgi:hypothetical protein
MNSNFTAEEKDFQQEVQQFLQQKLPKDIARKTKSALNLSKKECNEWQKILYKQGWAASNWPVEHGGTGWTPTQKYIFANECAKAGGPDVIPFGLKMVAPIIYTFGSEEQKQRFLPDILASNVWWCQGYSETGAGSDLAAMKTTAVKDGYEYVVNGTKTWTTLGQHADWIFCLVRTDDSGIKQKGITFLLFPMKQEGIEIKPIITLGGAHTVNTVHFTDVKVPVENRIGEEGNGWTYAKGLLEHERTGLAGLSKSLFELEKLKDQARTVTRGNGNLMDDSGYKAKIAELEIDLMATEYTELRSLASAAAGGKLGPESSILKLKGTEIKQRIQKLTVEASGIYSPAWGDKNIGLPFAKGGTAGYLNSRYFTIYGGASEVQKDVVAKKVLGLTKGSTK